MKPGAQGRLRQDPAWWLARVGRYVRLCDGSVWRVVSVERGLVRLRQDCV